MKDKICDQVRYQVRKLFVAQVFWKVRDQVFNEVRDQVWDQVRDQVYNKLNGEINDER